MQFLTFYIMQIYYFLFIVELIIILKTKNISGKNKRWKSLLISWPMLTITNIFWGPKLGEVFTMEEQIIQTLIVLLGQAILAIIGLIRIIQDIKKESKP